MKIIQFTCPDDEIATKLKELMVNQVNEWSRLKYLANDPEYVTSFWGPDIWQEHLETPNLWWTNYDAIYDNLGETGRNIADQMLGFGNWQGIMRLVPLVIQMPDMLLQIVDIEDPVAAGYLTSVIPEAITE
jgi:hypothetical protein